MISSHADLETAIADMREEADTLARAHANVPPERLREWANIVERSAEEWLTFIPEGIAAVRAGRSEATIRARYFEPLKRDGHARERNGRREYRECFIPRRAQIDEAAERGREAARAAIEQERKAS